MPIQVSSPQHVLKLAEMPLTIGRFFFFFFFQIPILLNTQSQSQGMLKGLLVSFIIVSSGLQIILNCQGDSDYPLISVFRITHVSSYGQAIELKVYLQEKKSLFACLSKKEIEMLSWKGR